MRKRIIIGLVYLVWGALHFVVCGIMIHHYSLLQLDLVSGRLKILKEALKVALSGNMSEDQILCLSSIIGFLGTLVIGLTLIIIGIFLVRPGYELPKVHYLFVLMLTVLFLLHMWIYIKYIALGAMFNAVIIYGLIFFYAWYSRRRYVQGQLEGWRKIGKGTRYLFYFLLAALLFYFLIPFILDLELPEGIMIEQ